MIYIITMILATIFIYYFEKKIYKRYMIISFLIALFPIAFRYGIGTDYFYTYYPYFNLIGEGKRYFDEIGFNLLNKFIYILTKKFEVLIFITAFWFLYNMYKGILENSKNMVFSIILLFIGQAYFYSMNMIRQSIAISIIFYSIKYLKENKKNKYILMCLIASTIHISAILMVILVFADKIKLKNNVKMIIILFVIILSPIIESLMTTFILTTKYAWYYDSEYSGEKISTILVVLNIVVLMLDLFYSSKNKDNNEYKLLSNINFISIILLIVANTIPLLNRLVRYFTIFHILFIPMIIESESNNKTKLLLKWFVFNLFFMTMYYQIYILGGEEVIPYISIFNS